MDEATHAKDPDAPAAGRAAATRRVVAGGAAGLVAAAAGLAVAEVVAAASSSWRSPVLDVGDRVVDGVPPSVKEWAIERFGTNDKVVLLWGIGAVLALFAVAVGIAAFGRRRWPAVAGAVALGAVGAYASLSTRRQASAVALVPSVVAAGVAAVALLALRRAATAPPEPAPTIASRSSRRRFLAAAGATGLGAALVGVGGRRLAGGGASASRAAVRLPAPSRALAAPGPDVQASGAAPFFTPNAAFYRIDTALTVPQVPTEGWSLVVDGRVAEPLRFAYDDLLARELVEADITLACVSNEVGGGLVGTARWLGVRLADLLEEAGVDPSADQVVGRSVDGFTCGFPVASAGDALVAVGMNGEPLPLRHGFPARLIVPGLYGYVSATKWLEQIELTRFDDFDAYWARRDWAAQAPIKTQSRIDTPKGLARLSPGPVAVAGVAWAPTRGIDRVDVRVDDGPWEPAELAAALGENTWRQWWWRWEATPGRHRLSVRAVDGTGAIQTATRAEPFPNGASGHHQIVVLVGDR